MHHIYKDYYPGNIVVPVLKDVNLNVEECRCGTKPVDPRLEILKNLIS